MKDDHQLYAPSNIYIYTHIVSLKTPSLWQVWHGRHDVRGVNNMFSPVLPTAPPATSPRTRAGSWLRASDLSPTWGAFLLASLRSDA
jgi:hypothetical protein